MSDGAAGLGATGLNVLQNEAHREALGDEEGIVNVE